MSYRANAPETDNDFGFAEEGTGSRHITLLCSGDYYEAMGSDAAIVAQVCGVSVGLTKYGEAHAGFPRMHADRNLALLMYAGVTVILPGDE